MAHRVTLKFVGGIRLAHDALPASKSGKKALQTSGLFTSPPSIGRNIGNIFEFAPCHLKGFQLMVRPE
jgi:hypothetical protein